MLANMDMLQEDKVILSEFENTVEGCLQARDFLLSLGKWSDDLHRRDGWEIIGTANKEIKKHNDRIKV